MSIDIQLARILAQPMLNDRGIKKALARGKIKIYTEISDDQIQPGSLDARIGETYIFDNESMIAVNKEISKITSLKKLDFDAFMKLDAYESSRDKAKFYPDKEGIPIIIPPHALAEIYFHEKISFDRIDFDLTYELRSSRGRLGLKPDSKYPKIDKSYFVEIRNANNDDIILYGQNKFANLFFNVQRRLHLDKGRVITNPKRLKKLLPEFAEKNLITSEGYVMFEVGKVAKTFKPGRVIDTAYPIDESFYDIHDLSKGYILNKDTPAIVQLAPDVSLPKNIGIMLTHRIPFHSNMQQYGFAIADYNQVNAGWVDQGYNGALTGHPVYFMMSRLLKEGKIFSFGVVYEFNTDSDRAYGDMSLKSHYQHSTGATTAKS